MRKKCYLVMMILSMILSNITVYASETHFSGEGTSESPYLIQNAGDLVMLANLTNDKATADDYVNKVYKLTTDIDMSGVKYVPISLNLNGMVGEVFTGTFDGNGHVIKNVSFDMTKVSAFNAGVGIIGTLSTNGNVKNLGVENVSAEGINKTYFRLGGIVGCLDGETSKIEGCYVKGMTVSSTVSPTMVGGIVGRASSENAIISDCYTTDISFTLANANNSAGIVGGSDKSSNIISNCYTTASRVQGNATSTGGTIPTTNCYMSSTLANMSAEILGDAFKSNKTVKNDGLPLLEWESNEGYDLIGPEFDGEGTEESPYIIASAKDLTKLAELTNSKATANDYAGKYYLMTNDIDMTGIKYVPVSFSSNGALGDVFTGTFDGDGHIIKNVTYDMTYVNAFNTSTGIIGVLGAEGVVKNLGVENVTVGETIKTYCNIGGVAGSLAGTGAKIERCYVKEMEVTTTQHPTFVGGIVGRTNGENVKIESSYSKGLSFTMSNASNSGGIVGSSDKNSNIASNCYTTHSRIQGAQGSVNGSMQVSNCFATVTDETIMEASILGDNFEADTELINDGMPILLWEFDIAHPETVYYSVKSGENDIVSDASGISVENAIVINFDKDMNIDTFSKIKVFKEDVEFEDYIFETEKNKLIIKINFEYNTKYTVFIPKTVLSQKDENGKSAKADEKKITFRTESVPKAVTVKSVKINGQDEVTNIASGDEITVEAVVENTGDLNLQPVALMVMVFGQDKIMRRAVLDTCTLKDTEEILKVQFTVPENAGKNPRLKVMVWDSITNMNVMR